MAFFSFVTDKLSTTKEINYQEVNQRPRERQAKISTTQSSIIKKATNKTLHKHKNLQFRETENQTRGGPATTICLKKNMYQNNFNTQESRRPKTSTVK